MASSMWGSNQERSTKISVSCLQSNMVVEMSWSKAAWVLQVLENYISLRETNSNIYCEILQQTMIPSLQKLGSRAVFQHDNDPKHTSKTTIALLKRLRVKVIDWPSMSPDLNPIKTSLGDPQAEGGGVQSPKYLSAPRRRHGGVEEHSSGYLWSSGKLHTQENKGSSG